MVNTAETLKVSKPVRASGRWRASAADADLPGEEWKPTITAGYTVSNLGRVRGPTGRLVKPWVHKSGHLYLRLGAGTPNRQVHRLVLLAFVGPPEPGQESLHGPAGQADNGVSNLRWGTRKENIEDMVQATGKSPRASLTIERANEIRSEREELPRVRGAGLRQKLADKHGVPLHVVNDLSRNYRRTS